MNLVYMTSRNQYRAEQTAGHLRVGDVICIATYTSPLKTNDVAAENKPRFELSNL